MGYDLEIMDYDSESTVKRGSKTRSVRDLRKEIEARRLERISFHYG